MENRPETETDLAPRASVVMTVYTDQRFLDAAVDSILTQEFRDLELVIVDDATGDHVVFEALARRDPRIRIVTNPTNLGPAAAANRGIEAARGDIILRLDCDDIAEPTHVGRLVAALDEDSDLGLVGNAVTLIDEADRVVGGQLMPETDLAIRWTILFHNPFYHSSMAYRRSGFEAVGGYKADQWISHDHYLCFALLPLCRARNLAEPLTRYRLNTQGLSTKHSKNARNRTHPIREALWAKLGLTYDLYDDAFARDMTEFIRGHEIAVERRAAAYCKLLAVLRVFLAAARPFERAEDADAARQLAHGLVARMLASPPLRIHEMLRVCSLCWPLDRRAATRAAMKRLAAGLKARLRATRKWLGEAAKIEPSPAPSPGVPALPREAGQARDIAEKSVEFVLIAEAGILEAQALLLCESIRCFAGAYSRCPITVVSPRSSHRPSVSTLRKLEQMDVEYLPIEIESYYPQYGTSYRIHALAHVERRPGPPIIIQLDSDTIFVAEPDFSLGASSAAARPVDVKGMCTTGPGDPFDSYWRKLCALVGVDYDHLPIVHTTVGSQAVRASYNGGLFVAKRACGLFQHTEDIFRQLVAADMKSWADGPTYNTGTGVLHGEATAYWGTSQAAFSLASVAGNHSVRLLPDTHNFPLNNLAGLPAPDAARLVHIHYHHLFSAGSAEANPILDGTLALPAAISEWLLARLPLQEQPQPTVTTRDLALDHDALVRTNHDLSLQRDMLVRDRDALRAERDAILASRSWRLTAPLRWALGPFARRR
ncbi:glycosyltransferase family 2 protein [Mesorhizobium sophorae]|uniref:glycosyltransferase family 2 protein n=1 Tax=Mesorhizobium sophorae TaxID=1300294 RepID=UPI00117F3AF2|nr:glycosyltransferase [Mesorhizobium sophorae]